MLAIIIVIAIIVKNYLVGGAFPKAWHFMWLMYYLIAYETCHFEKNVDITSYSAALLEHWPKISAPNKNVEELLQMLGFKCKCVADKQRKKLYCPSP